MFNSLSRFPLDYWSEVAWSGPRPTRFLALTPLPVRMLQGTKSPPSLSPQWPTSWTQTITVLPPPRTQRASRTFATSSTEPSERASPTPWTVSILASTSLQGPRAPNRLPWTHSSTTARVALPITRKGAGRNLHEGEKEEKGGWGWLTNKYGSEILRFLRWTHNMTDSHTFKG